MSQMCSRTCLWLLLAAFNNVFGIFTSYFPVPMPQKLSNGFSVIYNDTLFYFGGYGSNNDVNTNIKSINLTGIHMNPTGNGIIFVNTTTWNNIASNILPPSSDGLFSVSQSWVSINNLVYIVNPQSSIETYNHKFITFDLNSLEFQTLPNTSYNLIGICVTNSISKIFVVGGSTNVPVQIYSIPLGQWSYGATMSVQRSFAGCSYSSLYDNIYVFGGYTVGIHTVFDVLQSIEKYDISLNQWSDAGDLFFFGRYHTKCITNDLDNNIYCIGGLYNSYVALNSINQFDPSTETSTFIGGFNEGIYSFMHNIYYFDSNALLLISGGEVYINSAGCQQAYTLDTIQYGLLDGETDIVIGTTSSPIITTQTTRIYMYSTEIEKDPGTVFKWFRYPLLLPTTLHSGISAIYDDRLFVFGGFEEYITAKPNYNLYELDLNQINCGWTQSRLNFDVSTFAEEVPSRSAGIGASLQTVTQQDNRVYLFAPQVSGRYPTDSNMYIFDLEAKTFLDFAEYEYLMPNSTIFGCAVSNAMHIYYVGGYDQFTGSLLRIYDTTTNTWTLGGTMNKARRMLQCAISPKDEIFVLGGSTSESSYDSSIERANGTYKTEWYLETIQMRRARRNGRCYSYLNNDTYYKTDGNGLIFCMGGYSRESDTSGELDTSFEVFDFYSGSSYYYSNGLINGTLSSMISFDSVRSMLFVIGGCAPWVGTGYQYYDYEATNVIQYPLIFNYTSIASDIYTPATNSPTSNPISSSNSDSDQLLEVFYYYFLIAIIVSSPWWWVAYMIQDARKRDKLKEIGVLSYGTVIDKHIKRGKRGTTYIRCEFCAKDIDNKQWIVAQNYGCSKSFLRGYKMNSTIKIIYLPSNKRISELDVFLGNKYHLLREKTWFGILSFGIAFLILYAFSNITPFWHLLIIILMSIFEFFIGKYFCCKVCFKDCCANQDGYVEEEATKERLAKFNELHQGDNIDIKTKSGIANTNQYVASAPKTTPVTNVAKIVPADENNASNRNNGNIVMVRMPNGQIVAANLMGNVNNQNNFIHASAPDDPEGVVMNQNEGMVREYTVQ